MRVVRNRALTARATLQRREGGQQTLDAETLVLGEPDPADRAMRSEEARRVNSCLANLPANHRRSVSLVYFEGLTHSELPTGWACSSAPPRAGCGAASPR